MKFGKQIQEISKQWATPFYINYKYLKKIIKLQDPKTLFFYHLERELEKVVGFYELKLQELVNRLVLLEQKSGCVLLHSIVQFQVDLQSLQHYVSTNQLGFTKILKKYDKRCNQKTRELYLVNKIDIQPIFSTAKSGNVLVELGVRAGILYETVCQSLSSDGITRPSFLGSLENELDELLQDRDALVRYLCLHGLLDDPSSSHGDTSGGDIPGNEETTKGSIDNDKKEQIVNALSLKFLDYLQSLVGGNGTATALPTFTQSSKEKQSNSPQKTTAQQLSIIKILLQVVDTNVCEDMRGWSGLILAVCGGFDDIVCEFIRGSVGEGSSKTQSATMDPSGNKASGSETKTRTNLNHLDFHHRSAIHYSTRYGYLQMTIELVRGGCDVSIGSLM
jgi:hypothetical protein